MSPRVCSAALLVLVSACAAGAATPPQREFDGARALERARAQLAFGPRIPGSDGHAAMATWLDSAVHATADSVMVQRWQHVTLTGDSVPMVNVMARFNPAATKRILYFAHWDTRPIADSDSSRDKTAPVPGANDAASGVSILLGVADALKAKKLTSIGVDLVFVDGEDFGKFEGDYHDVLIGSRYLASHLAKGAKPDFAVLFDMVGAKEARIRREGYSSIAAPDVVDQVWSVAERMGYGHIFIQEAGQALIDDHKSLIDAGIRTIDIIGWPYHEWHTPDDTLDKLSVETLEAVGNVAIAVLREVDQGK